MRKRTLRVPDTPAHRSASLLRRLWFAAGLTAVLLAGSLVAGVMHLRETLAWIDHTDVVIGQAHFVERLLIDEETGIRGYLLSHDRSFLEPFVAGGRELPPALDRLIALVADNPPQQVRARQIAGDAAQWRAWAERVDPAAQPDVPSLLARKKKMDALRTQLASLVALEEQLRDQRSARSRSATVTVLTATGLGALAAATVLAWFALTVLRSVEAAYAAALRRREESEESLRVLASELETRVAARTQELSTVNAELEAFSYSVSHDLRAPLRAVSGFSEAVLEDFGDQVPAQAREHLHRVRAAASRMGQLIDDLLELSRVSRGALAIETVDFSALATRVGSELARSQPRVHFQVQAGLTVRGDPRLLRIALENLLSNAWKFSRKVAAPRVEVGRAGQELYVRDNGAGFDPQYAVNLFKPFRRLHRESEFEGTGVGLATVERVVARHRGSIRAVSKPDEGATFFFTLG